MTMTAKGTSSKIILNNLSFSLEQTPVRFNDITLSFENEKYGIIGKNGIGKTSFLKLLTGDLSPNQGTIQRAGKIINIPQNHAAIDNQATIADVLSIRQILRAIENINHGSTDENDFELATDQWDIEHRIQQALSHFNLWPIDLSTPFHHLSGGQKTKILLAKTMILQADILILDEPTNNLDKISRQLLYQFIAACRKTVIIVSHDRELLNKCNKILEITSKGIDSYGGNYDFYKLTKERKLQALQQEIKARTEILQKAKKTIQSRMERHQQGQARGKQEKLRQIKGKGSYNKIEIKAKKGKSEATNRRIRLQSERKLETTNKELSQARAELEIQETLDVCLKNTHVPNNKTVIQIENLSFSYQTNKTLIRNFNLHLTGPTRIAIQGPNGCGKSTLIKLIRGTLTADSGKINTGVAKTAYLDQNVSFLDPDLSLVENFLKCNPHCQAFDAYRALAAFKFRNKDAEKITRHLSGGEKMRAGLAISLMSTPAPQLIILDEPTNHLDLEAIDAIEIALKQYQGAIIAISHDENFLKNINIEKRIEVHSP